MTTTAEEIEERFWEELEKSPFVMLGMEHREREHAMPMTVHFDGRGPLWIYTARDNRLVEGLGAGNHALMQYVAKGHDLFASLHGTLCVDNNVAAIDRFWSNQVAAWYPQGRGDPSLTMLRFDPDNAELWLADFSVEGKFKLMFGGDLRAEGQQKHIEVAM